MSPFKAVLEVTKVDHVNGADENSNILALTRVHYHRFDKDVNSGEIGPDHNDEGSMLFVGTIEGNRVLDAVKTEVDDYIEVSFAEACGGQVAAAPTTENATATPSAPLAEGQVPGADFGAESEAGQ